MSFTVTVMVVLPEIPAAGVMVSRRSAPLPDKTSPEGGTSLESPEVTLTVNKSAGVSLSDILNGRTMKAPCERS